MIDGYHEASSPLAELLAAGPHAGLGPGAVSGTQITMSARAVDDGILLEGPDVDGSPLSWTFTDITPEAFHWQGRIQDADGTWRLEQDMRARRRPEPS